MTNKQKITDTSCPSCWENKNNIDECLEEFDDKWKMSIEASGFMKNDRRGIEFYVVKEWLKQKLQQVKKETVEEINEWAKSRKGLFKNDYGSGYEAMIMGLIAFIGKTEPLQTKE